MMDYKDFFDLGKVSEKSNFYPKVQNYSCFVKLLNCPPKNWIVHNLKGCLKKKGKKNSLSLIIESRKIGLKSIKLAIPKTEIEGAVGFLRRVCSEFSDSLIIPKKCKCKIPGSKKCECRFKTVLNLNNMCVKPHESAAIFEFINDIYLLRDTENKDEFILDKYFSLEKEKILRKKKLNYKKTLIIKFKKLKIDGENNLDKIREYILAFCRMINLITGEGKKLISDIKNLKATNLIYKIKVPTMFTSNLHLLRNNISPNILGLNYTVKLSEQTFPSIRIKIYSLIGNEHDKTTVSIFRTGFIIITGVKNTTRMQKIYEKLIYFLSFVFGGTFNDVFRDKRTKNNDFISTKEKFIKKKLDEVWQIEKIVFETNYKELKFRKSDLKRQNNVDLKKQRSEYEVDLKKLKSGEVCSFFDETLNLFNFYSCWSKESISCWLDFYF